MASLAIPRLLSYIHRNPVLKHIVKVTTGCKEKRMHHEERQRYIYDLIIYKAMRRAARRTKSLFLFFICRARILSSTINRPTDLPIHLCNDLSAACVIRSHSSFHKPLHHQPPSPPLPQQKTKRSNNTIIQQ